MSTELTVRMAHNAGLEHLWDIPLYGKLLEIGGGKERMTKYFLVYLYVCWLFDAVYALPCYCYCRNGLAAANGWRHHVVYAGS